MIEYIGASKFSEKYSAFKFCKEYVIFHLKIKSIHQLRLEQRNVKFEKNV